MFPATPESVASAFHLHLLEVWKWVHGCSCLDLFTCCYYLLLSKLLIASLGVVPGNFVIQICSHRLEQTEPTGQGKKIWFRLALLLPRPQRCGLTSLVTRCSALIWAPCVACLPQTLWEPVRPPDKPKGLGKSLTSTLVTVLLCLDQLSELMDLPFIRGKDMWTRQACALRT